MTLEPRGPHLPDAIARIPLGVWPFVALAALAAYGQWEELRTAQVAHPMDVVLALAGSVAAIAAPLLGAALYLRHPDAHRSVPAVTFGAVLFAATTVVDSLRAPVLDGIAGSNPEFDSALLAATGYSIVQALVRVFAATYLALGLEDARRFEDRAPSARLRALLLVGVFGSLAVTAFISWPWPEDQIVTFALSLGATILTNLAWAYVGFTAYRGWVAGEEPNPGWGLVAAAGFGQLLVTVAATLLSVVVWVVGPTESQVPLVFEAFGLLGLVVAGLWIALLAAFWLGLPAVDEDAGEAEDAVDAEEAVEPG